MSAGQPVLFHSAAWQPEWLDALLAPERIRRQAVASLAEVAATPRGAAVLVLDEALAGAEPDLPAALRALPAPVVVLAASAEADRAAGGGERVLLTLPTGREGAARALRGAFRHSAERAATVRLEAELGHARAELRELAGIGVALMTERDHGRLLGKILQKARELTGSDAGSLYLLEEGEDGHPRLRAQLAQNDSVPEVPFVSFTLPIDRSSLAGYAAVTGETLRIDDAYDLPPDAPYSFNRSFDERIGYRTRSMLVVPMIDHVQGVVGVLQLINRKRDKSAVIRSEDAADRWVVSYRPRELEVVNALAGQAAVSIENALLYAQIEHLFESFVKAAVIAVDQRDPATSGHSVRVATLTCDLAAGLDRHGSGAYAGVRFTPDQMKELRYAALLHDFGKVGVREEVLVKAKKLPALLQERVLARFDLIRRTLEMEYHRERADYLERGGRPSPELEAGFRRRVAELDAVRALVLSSNEPSLLPEAAAAALDGLAGLTFRGPDDVPLPYVTDEELRYLRIAKGSLDEAERLEIESHVEQTYRFLTQIPWTGDLRNVAEIAYGHHEKLNGRGYPRGVAADDIPVQTRIMTVADIFDALTASDRPYKRAVPIDRALDILSAEAREGLLDAELVTFLIESGSYRRVLEVDWKEL